MHSHISKFISKNTEIRKSVAENLFIFIASIIQQKTVNLNELKNQVGKITKKYKTGEESHYKRLTRFLQHNRLSTLWVHALTYGLELLNQKIDHCYLDATEWKIGLFNCEDSPLHILVLATDYKGIAIPIYFEVFEHKGVLSEQERMAFMERACSFCPLAQTTLIGDREFIGDAWFTCLVNLGMNFIIRIRKNMYQKNLCNGRSYESLQKRAKRKGKASELIKIKDTTFRLWLIDKKNDPKEPFIYILTNILDKRQVPDLYRLRWKIELLFKYFKTNGYNLEDLRITDLNKIRLMITMLTLACIFTILAGKDREKEKPTKQKKYADGRTFDAVSVFKRGESFLKQHFISLTRFLDLIQFLNVHIKGKLPYDIHFVQ